MTEQKQTEFKTGTYMGYEFLSEGIVQQGKNKGKEWKRYKLKFRIQLDGGEFDWNFTAFAPLTKGKKGNGKDIPELKDGEAYSIGYSTEMRVHEESGEEYESKQIFYIGPKRTQTTPKSESPHGPDHLGDTDEGVPTGASCTEKIDVETYDEMVTEFITIYEDNTPTERRHESHFIGAFFRWAKGLQPELVEKLLKAFETKVKNIKEEEVKE